MGRRSINTTKSGKFMNPTDQARKEARKKELKKNKRQRLTVRHAVLKGKDPMKLLEEIELIDQIEFDPMNPPSLNEKVLKEKRRKLKETFYRVLKLYEKEDPEYMVELKKNDAEQDKRREKLQLYYEQVKNTERVQIDQIPLPEMFHQPAETGLIPLPDDLPLPASILKGSGRGILKHASFFSSEKMGMIGDGDHPERRAQPPGPPPGSPTPLSDSEDEEYDPARDLERVDIDVDVDQLLEADDKTDDSKLRKGKQRKIRFADDDKHDPTLPEKDTRVTFKQRAPVTPLQIRMLQMAGQAVPRPGGAVPPGVLNDLVPELPPPPPGTEREDDKDDDDSSSDSDDSDDEKTKGDDSDKSDKSDKSDSEDDDEPKTSKSTSSKGDKKDDASSDDDDDEDGMPIMPPGPPPGMPPTMILPPGIPAPPIPSGMAALGPQAGLPRHIGLPPGPPPGLPPRGIVPRMPPGVPPGPPPRIVRPLSMNIPPPSIPLPPGLGPLLTNPSVLSAPPSIMKPAINMMGSDRVQTSATIEAKPQIKNFIGDSTRFMPTALKIKRQVRDSKGRIRHIGKEEEKINISAPKHANKTVSVTKTKDHAYEAFMKEMSGLM